MPGDSKAVLQCSEFEALLSEALEGTLGGEKLSSFRAHAEVCALCGPLFGEADAGRRWLKSLPEVVPPAHLVNRILAATSGVSAAQISAAPVPPRTSWLGQFRAWLEPALIPVLGVVRQPRFAMSFGMAFFSISIALNVAGVKLSDLRNLDLRPSALVRTYHMTSGKVVKYYENIRLVYQIESKVRELKRATTPAEPAPEREPRRRENNTSGQPEPRQERNYSQEERQPVLAFSPHDPPAVTVTTTRRFV